jgi:hypothetical protein
VSCASLHAFYNQERSAEEKTMSMVCGLRQASDQDIERLILRPEGLQAFIESDQVGVPEVEIVRPKGLLGLLLRLTPITIEQTRPRHDLPEDELFEQARPSGREVDLDKAWHGLHFLFTDSAWEGDEPGCFLVRGGQEIGDED